MPGVLGAVLALAASFFGPAAAAEPAPAGSVSGTVLTRDGSPPKQAVVYLEGGPAPPAPTGKVALSQRGARFRPDFLVVVVGQTVDMPNDDRITHNEFANRGAPSRPGSPAAPEFPPSHL